MMSEQPRLHPVDSFRHAVQCSWAHRILPHAQCTSADLLFVPTYAIQQQPKQQQPTQQSQHKIPHLAT